MRQGKTGLLVTTACLVALLAAAVGMDMEWFWIALTILAASWVMDKLSEIERHIKATSESLSEAVSILKEIRQSTKITGESPDCTQ